MAVSYPNWINPYPGHADFIPKAHIVVGITNDYPALVTTSEDNHYQNYNIIRIDIPLGYGMQEINTLFGVAIVMSPTTFLINIDTRLFSPFTIPVDAQQSAQCIPIGEINEVLYNATFNRLLQSTTE